MATIQDNSTIRHGWLRALGRADLPITVIISGEAFRLVRTFKHDFFAATGQYMAEADGRPVVLKIGRRVSLWGLPTAWIGRYLSRREGRLYELLQGIEGIPGFTGYWEATGLAHAYVEGAPLAKDVPVDDAFFPRLSEILDAIHQRGAAYVDLEKRENVLLGTDGRPYLIDFQISFDLRPDRGGRVPPLRWLLRMLQSSDRYHLLKHWRRLRPDQLTAEQVAQSYRPPFWIAWHRILFRPFTLLRRWVLVRLGERRSTRVRSPG